jgi:hypothetical protein
VKLAARGRRDLDRGSEAIDDAGELARVRRQARAVYSKALLAAVVLTALAVLLP